MRHIFGASAGGGSASTPVEDPNSLRAKEYARIIDIVSEGEIGGLVNGKGSIYLEGVPLQNADGVDNYQGMSMVFQPGTPAQGYVPGFSYVETETQVGVKVEFATPVVRSIANPQLTSARVRVSVPTLTTTDVTTGDIKGGTVGVAIDVQASGGGWVNVHWDGITGKCVTKYVRQYTVPLAGSAPWNIRVRRTSPDAATTNIQDTIYFESFTEVIDVKLKRPNTAYFAVQADSSQFSSVPTRSYKLKGRIIRVPSNYDAEAKTYSGMWDGTFKLAYSSNPAWVYYDLVTHPRYGLQKFADTSATDIWNLYEIGQYCDERVPDGFGGQEPRYTCNHYINSQKAAYELLNDIASNFDAIPTYGSGAIGITQDAPRDAVHQYTPSNVLNGKFTYSESTAMSERHSVVRVTWNDPDNHYKRAIEVVVNEDLVRTWGYRPADIVAVGCTSRGQAQRRGRRLLYTEATEADTVSFSVASDGAFVFPGHVIEIADPLKNGQKRLGGRIKAATINTIEVDQWENPGTDPVVHVVMPDGGLETRSITGVAGNVLTVSPNMSGIPTSGSVWVANSATAVRSYWRVLTVTQGKGKERNTYQVNAIKHDPDKFAAIDLTPNLQVPTNPGIPIILAKVTGIVFQESLAVVNQQAMTRVSVGWNQLDGARKYIVRYRIANGNWIQTEVTTAMIDIDVAPLRTVDVGGDIDIQPTLDVQISGVSPNNIAGPAGEATYTILGESLPPIAPEGLVAEEAFVGTGARIKWVAGMRVAGYTARVYNGSTLLREVYLGDVTRYEYTFENLKIDNGGVLVRSIQIQIRAEGMNGVSGPFSTINLSNPAPVALTGVDVYSIPKSLVARCNLPSETDFAGILVWMSETDGFVPGPTNLAYRGRDTVAVINQTPGGSAIVAGTTYYLRMAAYDTFGETALNVSAQVSATGTTPGETVVVTLVSVVSQVPALADGTVLTYVPAQNNKLTVYVNAEDDTANWDIALTRTNCTTTGTNPYSIGALSADIGWVDFACTRAGFDPVTVRWTVSKQKQGATGADGPAGAPGETARWVKAIGTNFDAVALQGVNRKGVFMWNGFSHTSGGRGHTCLIYNPSTGSMVTAPQTFDTYLSGNIPALITYINTYASSTTIMMLYSNDACSMNPALVTLLKAYGGKNEQMWDADRWSHCFIGMRGLSPGQAYESIVFKNKPPYDATQQSYFTQESGITKNGADGTKDFTLLSSANVRLGPYSATKQNSGTDAWDEGAWSREFYSNGAFTSFTSGDLTKGVFAGLNDDPTASSSYEDIDLGWYIGAANYADIRLSGAILATFTTSTFTVNTVFSIKYDGNAAFFYIDGTQVATTTVGANKRYAFDCTLRLDGSTLNNIIFGPTGAAGPAGAAGTRGSVTIAAVNGSWSDSVAFNAIMSSTGIGPINNDIVTLYSGSFSETRFYSAGAWITLGSYMNGNLLVNGTVQGTKLVAGSVTADKIGVSQLSAVSAIIGTLRTSDTGRRLEFWDNILRVFDNSGNLRGKFGNLLL